MNEKCLKIEMLAKNKARLIIAIALTFIVIASIFFAVFLNKPPPST